MKGIQQYWFLDLRDNQTTSHSTVAIDHFPNIVGECISEPARTNSHSKAVSQAIVVRGYSENIFSLCVV